MNLPGKSLIEKMNEIPQCIADSWVSLIFKTTFELSAIKPDYQKTLKKLRYYCTILNMNETVENSP
jgi:hypothetical protein